MAFFKLRKGDSEPLAAPGPAESAAAMRRRARHRLIGAAVLVLVGVIGFPLLFDTQPRPIAVDIPIDIPDRNKTKPLALPAAPAAAQAASEPATAVLQPNQPLPGVDKQSSAIKTEVPPAAAGSAKPAAAPAAVAAASPAPAPAPAASRPVAAAAPPAAKPEPKPADPKPVPAPAAAAAPDDGARARALLDGGAAAVAGAEQARFIVQVGAFADPTKARETRLKVERAGLKTYTHVAETKDGKRIRVRVGPFATRAEADQAADKIKKLDLQAAILTL